MCDMVQEEPQRCGLPAGDRVVDGCDAEDVGRRIGRLGRPGSAVSIRASEPRSPMNAEVKTSSRAPAARSSDSTAERRFIRDAHSGVTKITRSNAGPVTPTGR